MSSTLDREERTLATEKYEPTLSDQYNNLFHILVTKMGNTLPSNRAEIIKAEITRVSKDKTQDDIEALKYIAALSVLVDLSLQGWAFDVNGTDLTLKMDTGNVNDKQQIRYRLSAERNAQFRSNSVSTFIRHMEAVKQYQGINISIRNLIGNKNQLLTSIRTGERICDPYIQLVTNARDDYTGYKLSDIWRYFRYTWSIPYKTMPGRNLFYLVRDRRQPYHPVVGIFALGNSVLNLTVRDDDIGWTVEAIRKNKQLKKLKDMLNEGYRVYYIIVSLNPYVKAITIAKETQFFSELNDCIKRGMNLLAYSCRLEKDDILINQKIQVNIECSTNE